MSISLLQAFLIGVVYYLGEVGTPWLTFLVSYCGLYRPLIGGTLVGFILGDPVQGCIIGASINLPYIAFINAGGTAPSNPGIAGTLGTALAMAAGVGPEVAISIAIPLGLLGTLIWIAHMSIDVIFVHVCDKAAEEGDIDKLCFWNLWPPQIVMAIICIVPVTVGAYFGAEAVTNVITQLSPRVMTALTVVGGVLPALGIAMNLRAITRQGTLLFFIVGFLAVEYLSLSTLVIAIFSGIFAFIYTKLFMKTEDIK
jgi:PTS system mannose-specific IIC component